ncbi:MAG: DUF190 domain-containing protein [Methylococcales bacterium]|nr:DUF190 domain-containing protein [Methylococcales bacterium]
MSLKEVWVARINTLEGNDELDQALAILHNEHKILGLSIINGIADYWGDDEVQTAAQSPLPLELPLIIEFYDEPARVDKAISVLKSRLNLKHIICWSAQVLDA